MSMTNWWQVGKNPYAANMYAQDATTATTAGPSGNAGTAASWAAPALAGQGDWTKSAAPVTMYSQTAADNPLGVTQPTDGQPNWGGSLATLKEQTTPQTPATPVTPAPTTPAPPAAPWNGNKDYEYWENQINRQGNLGGQQWNGHSWQGGGPVAAGTPIMDGQVKTWVNYDASKDQMRNTLNENPESAWHLVNRWTADNVRYHNMSPQQAHEAALSELKRQSIEAGRDLNTVGFDLSNVPVGGKPGSPPPGNTTAGATSVSVPSYGQGAATGAQAAGAAADPNAQTVGTVPPAGKTGAPMSAYYKSNPGAAAQMFLAEHGVANDNQSPFAVLLRQLATNLAPSLVQTAGMGGGAAANDQVGQLPALLSSLIYGNGGQVFGNLGNYANGVMKQAQGMTGANAPLGNQANGGDVQQLLATILGLKTMGSNPLMAHAQSNALQSYFNDYERQAAQAAQANNPNFQSPAPWYMQHDPYGLFSR